MQGITSSKLIIITSIFFIVFSNSTFFTNVVDVYPLNLQNIQFLLSLVILSVCINVVLLSLVCFKNTIKPVLILLLLVSSLTAYFMDTYNVIIDESMIDNILKTDLGESYGLISARQILYLLFMGLLPSILMYKLKIVYPSLKISIRSRAVLMSSSLLIATVVLLAFGSSYASFFREHKLLRYYANPSYYVYSTAKYISGAFKGEPGMLRPIGMDATIPSTDKDRELIVFVVGETARADHWSLNGYTRKTNPYLELKNVVSFANFWSCGTSTAESVPCIFSLYSRDGYSKDNAKITENVLDILKRSGVNVLWLDNNSNSKGVASRVSYESYKSSDKNTVCDLECRDEGMLANLQEYINSHPQGDIFIVLHQMGNHGPAYYKRYPKQFEKFLPVCKTNLLDQCSNTEIINSYDNALLYTDYFLAKTIALLEKNVDIFESALFYVSDHGESLGEYGMYLHGLPYVIAPDSQKHVPAIMWFGEGFEKDEINLKSLKRSVNKNLSHDNIFHTILGLMEVETSVYDSAMDLIEHDHNT